MARPFTALATRFWAMVEKTDTCWLWTGRRLPRGYGQIGAGGRHGRPLYAHRVSWEIANGQPIPSGLQICHRCDNPPCVNPAHLFLGTQRENIDDCIEKGRQAHTDDTRHVGSENGRAKISETQALEIRRAYAELPRKQRVRRGSLKELAERYSITPTMVLMIVRHASWKHVEAIHNISITEI